MSIVKVSYVSCITWNGNGTANSSMDIRSCSINALDNRKQICQKAEPVTAHSVSICWIRNTMNLENQNLYVAAKTCMDGYNYRAQWASCIF